jgi:TRAP-type C4-dicarboxylate transport system substrate-binding protein
MNENSKAAQRQIRLGHVLGEDHAFHLASLRLGQLLTEKTNNEWQLSVIPEGRLGSENDLVRMLVDNKIEMANISTVNAAEIFPKLNVFSLPYGFDSPESAFSFLDSPKGKQMIAEFSEDTKIRWLSFVTYGVRDFATTKKPILKVEDLSGLSFRIPPNPIFRATYEAFGAVPKELILHEVLPALNEGSLDGTDIAPNPLWGMGYHKVIKHMSFTGLFVGIAGFLVSGSFWDSLNDEDRKKLEACAQDAAVYCMDVETKQTAEAMENLKAAGLNFYNPDPGPFKSKVKSVWKKGIELIGKDIINEIESIPLKS